MTAFTDRHKFEPPYVCIVIACLKFDDKQSIKTGSLSKEQQRQQRPFKLSLPFE